MSIFTSETPARTDSQRGHLTAVMGPVSDTASDRELRGKPAELNASEIANITSSPEINDIISECNNLNWSKHWRAHDNLS